MELRYKEDWEKAQEKWEAWWHGEIIDRVPMQIVAPKEPLPSSLDHNVKASGDMNYFLVAMHVATPGGVYREPPQASTYEELLQWFTVPEQIMDREERSIESIHYLGESFPVAYPVNIFLVALTSAYLGCPYKIHPGSFSGWAEPIIDDWETRPTFQFNPENEWWKTSKQLMEEAAKRADGKYYVSIPDLNGTVELLSRLRGTEPLAIDLFDNPEQVEKAIDEVNYAWFRYWQASMGIIHQYIGGYIYWMGLWSESPSVDLQCDFSAIISKDMFKKFVVPSLHRQTQWVGRTIYHLDGPDAIQHIDALVSLPDLTGIQWVGGAGSPPTTHYIPQLKKIQEGGKLLVAYCMPDEVETMLKELKPEGLLLNVGCGSREEGEELLTKVSQWTARKNRIAT